MDVPVDKPKHKPPTGSTARQRSGNPSSRETICLGSHQVCDAIYKEWLAKKVEEKQRSAKAARIEAEKEQAALIEKQVLQMITMYVHSYFSSLFFAVTICILLINNYIVS